MADAPSNKVEPHGTSVKHPDGGAAASGNFMADHKKGLIIGAVVVGGLLLAYALFQGNKGGGTAAANQATGTAAGSQDAGTATALTDLQTQFNQLQQLIASNTGTVTPGGGDSGSPIPMPAPGAPPFTWTAPIPVPTPQPTPGGPSQIFCQFGYARDNTGNCVPIFSGQGNPIPQPAPAPYIPPPIVKIITPIVNMWKPAASGVSGYEANGKSYYYNNGFLQSVGTLGSTSNIALAKAPAGWKPLSSGVSGYESNGYAAYYNNGSLQSVSKLGQR